MTKITQLSQLDLDATYSYADYLTWQLDKTVELIKLYWMIKRKNIN